MREALLLLALAFAAGGGAEGSRLAARGFAAFAAAAAGIGAGPSFGAEFSFCTSRETFRLASSPALTLRVIFL